MKNTILCFCFLIMLCAMSHAQVPFHRLGYTFTQTNIPLTWKASTHNLPDKLWVYQALPAKVSSDTISNLVALGAFTEKDRKKFPDYPSLIGYDSPDGKRSLRINTDWTFINYHDSEANDSHLVKNVPGRRQAFKMAKAWLPKLGIDENQLFPNSKSDGTRFYGGSSIEFLYPKQGGPAYTTNILTYAVTFYRALDGIEFSGGCARGGGMIEFGHDAKISEILVSWRNYKRDESYPTASQKTLLKWIHKGKAVWWPAPDSPPIDWNSVKKITITKATPLYFSEAYDENDTPQNTAYPFIELEAKADTGTTNLPFSLDCPIIDESKS